MKLNPKKGNGGHVTSYTLNLGSKEAREVGFLREDGSSRSIKKILDVKNKTIVFEIDWDAENAQEDQPTA